MRDKKSLIKKNSVLMFSLVSYISILLVPIVISAAVYTVSLRTIESEITRANTGMLRQVQQSIDSQIEGVENLGLNIGMNSRLNALILQKDTDSSLFHYNISQVIKEFSTYSVLNGFIDDFYIYFKHNDMVIRPGGIYTKELFYRGVHSYEDISYEKWTELTELAHVKDYIPLGKRNKDSEKYEVIAFMQSLPTQNPREADATAVITLDERRIQEVIKNVEWVNQGTVFILDRNDNILASTGEPEFPVDFDYGIFSGPQGVTSGVTKGERVEISHIVSEKYGLKYISILPSRVFMEKGYFIKRLTIISFALCFLLGGIIIYFFSRKNYSPLNELVEAISKRTNLVHSGDYNEYRFIREAISSTLDEKEKVKEKLNEQKKLLKNKFIMELLKGRYNDSPLVQDMMVSFDISFEIHEYAVILFYIEDFSKLFEDEREKYVGDKYKLVQFIISNVVEELAEQKNTGFATEIDEMVACLINFKSSDYEANKWELARVAKEAKDFLNEKVGIGLTLSISDVHHTFMGLSQSYQEALEAMQYKMITGEGKIIFYDDIKNSNKNYEYSLESEYKLINCIKIADYEKAMEIIESIFERNFSSEKLSVQVARCLMFDLASTMVKALNDINFGAENSFMENLRPVDRLIDCRSVKEMKLNMVDILKDICEYIDKNKKSHNTELSENIRKFILSNYGDANLSISNIAEEFNINPVYLSRLFKEQTGEGLLDFINKIRLEEAKKLLKKSDLSIGDIAVKMGYLNSNAFIRAFKKYEGITPGQYRA